MHFTSTRTKPRSLAHPFIHSCHVQLLSHTTINRYPQAEIKEAKQQISDLQEMVMLQRQVRYERARSASMSSLSPSVGEETAVAASGPKEKTLRTVRLLHHRAMVTVDLSFISMIQPLAVGSEDSWFGSSISRVIPLQEVFFYASKSTAIARILTGKTCFAQVHLEREPGRQLGIMLNEDPDGLFKEMGVRVAGVCCSPSLPSQLCSSLRIGFLPLHTLASVLPPLLLIIAATCSS